MGEDEWITEAMKDDRLVVEVLMRLRRPEERASLPTKRPVAVFPKWGFRQPRTRQILRCNSVQPKKEEESRRASPTTPLSWSGASSLSGSGAVDGYEESSHPVKRSSGVRSKVISTSVTAAGRRSRKKKTYAELKEEEGLLLKENIHLKKELKTLRSNFEEQRARNETFKRMKLDLQHQSEKAAITSVELKDADCELPDQMEANPVDLSNSVFPTHNAFDERDAVACPSSYSCRIEEKDAFMTNNFFALPDLNLPLEEDSNTELLYGIS